MTWPLTAKDLRKALKFEETYGDTEELNLFARAASERIEEEIGKQGGQVVETAFNGPADRVVLNDRATAVQLVTVDGIEHPRDALRLDGPVLHGPFPAGRVRVFAVAPNEPPPTVILAGRELAKLWWQQANNGPRGMPQGSGDEPNPMMGFAMPRRVAEMIEPYKPLPGMA